MLRVILIEELFVIIVVFFMFVSPVRSSLVVRLLSAGVRRCTRRGIAMGTRVSSAGFRFVVRHIVEVVQFSIRCSQTPQLRRLLCGHLAFVGTWACIRMYVSRFTLCACVWLALLLLCSHQCACAAECTPVRVQNMCEAVLLYINVCFVCLQVDRHEQRRLRALIRTGIAAVVRE